MFKKVLLWTLIVITRPASTEPLLASRVKCSRHQIKHLGWNPPPTPQKKVIAMVANVAAFGCVAPLICRHWGEEQLKIAWEGKRHTKSPLVLAREARSSLYVNQGEWCDFNTVQTRSDTILYSLKTLTSQKNKKHGTRPIYCKIPDHLKQQQQQKRDTFATVYNSGERSSSKGEAAPLCVPHTQKKKRQKPGLKASHMISTTWQTRTS